jgi:serine/threonine protein kinase/ribosomal protein L40E
MSISQTTPEETAAGQLFCPQCNAALPLYATFCSFCGERLKRKRQTAPVDEEDIHTRYRITTLVRRYPHSNLYFALDNHQTREPGHARTVAIRDIDITHLAPEAREKAIALAQQEYDSLRRWNIPHLLACTDLRLCEGHLFLVSGVPASSAKEKGAQRLYTLQDFLQSGMGLPRESRTQDWMRNLCQAMDRLHRQGMVLSDLDPFTVVLEKNSAQAEPKLPIFWLPTGLEKLLQPPEFQSTPSVSYFKAPEALAGNPEARSDIYSLGALLYLLLTGMPPDESTLRHRRRLRTPREINVRISQRADECAMQALAVEPEERFASVTDLLTTLENGRPAEIARKAPAPSAPASSVPLSDVETVRIVPLSQKDVERWRTLREEKTDGNEPGVPPSRPPASRNTPPVPPAAGAGRPQPARGPAKLPTTPTPGRSVPASTNQPGQQRDISEQATAKTAWAQRITNILPAAKAEKPASKKGKKATEKPAKSLQAWQAKHESEISLLKQIQRLILGQQQHTVEAAAIIETPMRIRPDQPYTLRLHIMGRDEPTPHPDAKKGVPPAGLSALVHGEIIQVEVRSVLQQGYTYILQQAVVTIPASGYAAEVTIPMQQQPVGATGRRDRLHIFFLDERRHPLYEKPFVVEIFVSPLVQFGREGHQVLTIPI